MWDVLRAGITVGVADLTKRYTWITWGLGWLLRGCLEVTFFALIGVLLGRADIVTFLVIGRGLFLACLEMLLVVQTVAWERQAGTLPLLMISPSRVWPVFVGRACQWFPSAVVTPMIVLLVLGPFFGVSFSLAGAVFLLPAVLVTALGSFGFALTVAAVSMRWPDARNLISNLTQLVIALGCGVFVPITFWPTVVQYVVQVVPLTHTIQAVRDIEAGAGGWGQSAVAAGTPLLMALALGAAWFVLGVLLVERHAATGRADGSIDLDE
ncbi:ABC transporter permease [Nocardiopsis sp. NRRL B-16309]|uniref:ABC transporter permease n=1 Tax=Nocardiopsis sp. NRRL B-16309 TaxID=1519494 RepID=UPI0006AE1FB7|nr:ABC transporter permease [Nocardiopsis sp. NRRL B-16309]KOX14237.1 hypothetical protein ADL05_16700 [Nocardiopsis sp. NRRL B-16309]